MTDTNTSGAPVMTAAKLLARMHRMASAAESHRETLSMTHSALELQYKLDKDAIAAVAALIEREAALVAEREASDKYGWIDGCPPFAHAQEWFLAETDFGPVVIRSLPDEGYAYDYTTADHTYFLKEQVKRWMQLPESDFIAYLSAGTIFELRAERDALAAEVKALREDAERWRHARSILTVDQIENAQSDYDAWVSAGETVSDEESKRADEAIDAARASAATGGGNG